MNSELSRIGGLVDDDGTTHLADYLYLGRNRTVEVRMTEPGVKFTWLRQSGDPSSADPYTGWDRFGRAVDLRWIKTSNEAELERLKHGYDEASNRLYRKNPVATGYSAEEDQLYGYDGLYQLKDFQRGLLNGGNNGISTLAARERFVFDPTGNWNSYQVNNDTPQTRLHNEANELTDIDSSDDHLAEDAAGNMTKAPQPGDWGHHYDLTYDAWNRLVKVADGETVVAEYAYDGLNRRIKKKIGSDTRHYYYSDQWQILEERVNASEEPDRQFVWGLRYTDDLILRDREMGEEDERLYVIQDYFQPTAVMSNTDGEVLERYGYDAFGTSRVLDDEFDPKPGGSEYEWETRYGAYRWDGETGLYQVRHRYLHSPLGRWVTRDPIGYAGGSNFYSYVHNSSVVFIDASGLLSNVNSPPASVTITLPTTTPSSIFQPITPPLPPNFEFPPPPDRTTPSFEPQNPFSRPIPWERPNCTMAEANILGALGGSHLLGTREGSMTAEFYASLFTAVAGCPRIPRTRPGDVFIRYESASLTHSRIPAHGGLSPGTYAAPASDGIVPLAERVPVYNLPDLHISRPIVHILTPPPRTPVVGPRPVAGGTGNEVYFPQGF